jgi:hypothetical protein
VWRVTEGFRVRIELNRKDITGAVL